MESFVSLFGSGLFVLVAACVGRLARGLFRCDKCSASERLLIDAPMGLGLASLVVFALSACQLLKTPWGLAAALAFVACGVVKLPDVIRDLAALLRSVLSKRPASSWLVGLLLLALAVSALVPALAPPSMSDWDSLAYHLAVPMLYLRHGGFYYIDFASHSNFPFLMEMLYTPWLALGLPVAAKMMHYWTAVLLVGSVAALLRRHLSPKAAPMAAIAIAGMPIVLWEATTAYIDLATALYTVLAAHLLLSYVDSSDWRHLLGCGAAAGFAASTKMTGLAVIPLLMAWLVIDRLAQDRRVAWRQALLLGGVGLAVCAPWYAKSFIYTGNPVYPFFYSIFGGKDWTADLASNYAMLQKRFGMGHDAVAFLLMPFNLTFHPEAFYDTAGLYVGPILLVLTPVIMLARYGSRKLVGLLGFFLAQLVIWFVLSHQSRYLIPAFAILAVLGAELATRDARFRVIRRALMAAFVLTALFGVATMVPAFVNAAPVVFGAESREHFLSRSLDSYEAQSYINSHLPQDAKVALFGDTRGFYLRRDYIWADPGHNARFTRSHGSPGDFVRYLRSAGITHAMVNFGFLPSPDKAKGSARLLYQAIDEGRLRQVYPLGDVPARVSVYELR